MRGWRGLASAGFFFMTLPGCCALQCYDPCAARYNCVRDTCHTSHGVDYMNGPVYGPESLPNYSSQYGPQGPYSTPGAVPNQYLIPPENMAPTSPLGPPMTVPAMPPAPVPAPTDAVWRQGTTTRNISLPSIPEHSPEAGLNALPSPAPMLEVPPPPAESIDQMRYRRSY